MLLRKSSPQKITVFPLIIWLINHRGQQTIVIRNVVGNGRVERFLTFFKNVGHKGRGLATAVLEYLSVFVIDIANIGASHSITPQT